ncbi:transposase [Corynebacterium sp. HMSC072G08]|uniref:Recombinase family protein n=1 Tax=Corynebacterium phoceense TaxID=1686286 RepID=A0A540R860_9CORY|nr:MULTISPECIES: recombinase family protein [Corynebacterium]OFN43613.1 transposase [Corynebacterium sp. HMSC072G08]TQE43933.1 recombinase family protein [Corynebacterium phoceense]
MENVSGQRVGYVRVSSLDQSSKRQTEALLASGKVDRFFEDKISGRSRAERPALNECIKYLRDGDELVVSSIDRLARSLIDLRTLVDEITAKGVTVYFLHENLRFTHEGADARSNLMLSILGSFAEFERAIIRERQAEGIALAQKAGKYRGRKRALSTEQIDEARIRIGAGESKAAVARELGIARTTLYAALNRDG